MSVMSQPRYREKMQVEVKRRDFTGAGTPVWKSGVVKEVTGKGCFVVVGGNSAFYNWNEIRSVQREELPAPPPLKASLTAVARVTDLRSFVKNEPPLTSYTGVDLGQVPESETAPSMEPRGSIERMLVTASRIQKPHRVTRCGEVFRRIRMNKAVGQATVAQALGATTQIISRIELGDALPSDDQLLRFSEWSGYDLADLEQKRESDARQLRLEPPKKAQPVQAPLRPAPPPPPLVDPFAQPFSVATDFVDFLQGLKRLVPCPASAEKRTAWMTAAEQLWELSQAPP